MYGAECWAMKKEKKRKGIKLAYMRLTCRMRMLAWTYKNNRISKSLFEKLTGSSSNRNSQGRLLEMVWACI